MIFEPNKTPGLDRIFSILLQKGLDILPHPLVKMRASIALRHVPRVWKDTKIVCIPKPERNGYIKVKNFKIISLSSFILKSMERLMDRYLKEEALTLYPLATSQYAYREGRSTETALHHLVGQVEI